MTRLTLRLARPNVLASLALLAALTLYAVLTRRAMVADLDSSGLSGCLGSGADCATLIRGFTDKFDVVINSHRLIILVPLVTGMFWGGPLVAREAEQGTHRFAWTQSVSRGRWLAVKLGVHLLGAAVVAAALTQLMTWWFTPLERVQDDFARLSPDVFDFRGIVPIAYTVFAIALGAAAGAIFKRTVPAMLITLVAYLPIKIAVQALRGHYLAPLDVSYAFGTTSPRLGYGDWILGSEMINRGGQILGTPGVADPCQALAGKAAAEACSVTNGYRFVDTYQPVGRFWPFQLIESGIFIGLSVITLAVAAWWVLRRTA
ncbi:ABC transporter permease [Kribbella koreensis]|uniref:ABC transporter permease n=1 Tax=Kribbella koreensis TaxID=57909 RepID=A0ABN1QTX3_9ACTN